MSSKKIPTRDRILKSTLALLEKGPGQQVRMSDIAKAARVSRQAVYLHFETRADLLVATTRYVDEVNEVDELLRPSRSARTGRDRLELWVEVWGNYIPKIHGVARALLAMQDTDAEARHAWKDRMNAVRHGCAAAVSALQKDGDLVDTLSETEAVDLLWSLQSVRIWEHLRLDCGWSQDAYLRETLRLAQAALIKPE